MNIDLNNKVAVVTGAAKGIGRVIAESLLKEGVKVSIWDKNFEELRKTYNELNQNDGNLIYSCCDVSKEEEVELATNFTINKFQKIDILVANAGIAYFSKVIDMDISMWDESFAVNTRGVLNCVKKISPQMINNNFGRIIIASSFATIIPSAQSAAYSSSKAALVPLVRVLSAELGLHNITVNAYAPGMIPTDMSNVSNLPVERQKELLDTLSIQEWGKAEDIASLIIFLSSEQARYITGTHIDASGGKFSVQFAKYAR